MTDSLTKKELILQKFENFITFLRTVSDKNEQIDSIKNLTVEQMLNMYVQHAEKFKDLDKSSIQLVILLDITPTGDNIAKIKKYLNFFDEILNI